MVVLRAYVREGVHPHPRYAGNVFSFFFVFFFSLGVFDIFRGITQTRLIPRWWQTRGILVVTLDSTVGE